MTDSDSPEEPDLAFLLVEDALDDALLVRTVLEKRIRCEVTSTQDGDRGCALAGRDSWDLVITDLNIPGRGGLDVIETSKDAAPDRPVLATTAYSGPDYLEAALASGADEVLVKPLDPVELVDRVRRLTGAPGRSDAEDEDDPGDRAPTAERTVLAVGAAPGDVELGCGGILMGHRAHGHPVHVLVMSAGADAEDVGARREAVERTARELGVRLLLGDPFRRDTPSTDAMRDWLRGAIRRIGPDVLYTPCPDDAGTARLRAHRAAVVEGATIPNHYCYQASPAARDFDPSLFVDVTDHLDRKLELLERYAGDTDGSPRLRPSAARSSARHWGRFIGSPAAEPLDVIRSST